MCSAPFWNNKSIKLLKFLLTRLIDVHVGVALGMTGDKTVVVDRWHDRCHGCFCAQAGVCSVHPEAGRSRTFPTMAEGGAGVCAADAWREDGVHGLGLRGPPHCPGIYIYYFQYYSLISIRSYYISTIVILVLFLLISILSIQY